MLIIFAPIPNFIYRHKNTIHIKYIMNNCILLITRKD
jgi:hypothetical protein